MKRKAFTLIELLVVIGVIAILTAVVLVAVNPSKRLAQARNATRSSDVENVLNAVKLYETDNGGTLPTCITTSAQDISSCTSLGTNLASYLVTLPVDPKSGATNYTVLKTSTNAVTVAAPAAEAVDGVTPTIQASR